jgi:hypothetical protein
MVDFPRLKTPFEDFTLALPKRLLMDPCIHTHMTIVHTYTSLFASA